METTYVATFGDSSEADSSGIEVLFSVSETDSATEPAKWQLRNEHGVHTIDAVRLASGAWSLLVNGRSMIATVDRNGDEVTAVLDGRFIAFELEDAKRRRLAKMAGGARRAKAKGETVRAPIAGKVVKLLIAVGDVVSVGTPLIVLEAMKMENELQATRDGTVQSIQVAEGDPVETRQVLVVIT